MRAATVLFTALALVASSVADDVPVGIAPPGESPEGCEQTVEGNFTISIAVQVKAKFKRETASEAAGSATVCTLEDGVLTDANGRIGSIVANKQFQFDGPPPQAGAVYTGGFSVCSNNSLALGPSTRWWRCMSGEFGNLYNESIGDQCSEIRIVAQLLDPPASSSSSSSSIASSTSTLASSSASKSASATGDHWSTVAPSTTATSNATVSSASSSGSGSQSTASAGSTTPVADAPNAQSSGAAVTTRAPKRETFGAVIGILGAALML